MKKLARTTWIFRYLLLALTALAAVQAISQESTPNLSGIWRWNPDKSQVSGRPATNRRVKIEQQGSDLTISVRTASEVGDEIHKFHYTIGSDDNTNEMMGASLKSKVQWKDGALSVESRATRDEGEIHISETWTLSGDGKTLTYHANRTMGDRPPREDTIVYEKQPEADWEAQEPPKLAKDVYKNIQILKGMPAADLMSAMQSFSHSLGVQCNFCHVMGAFEKDDNPHKQTARKMLMMAHQINGDNFGGHMRVTCWTCHRGAAEPESAPK
ncbi:MAG: c-type cytochrome [Terriglobia bacterium]